MILIPLHRKPDWSRPPWVTLALILLNLLVFVWYQGDDEKHLMEAIHIYQSQNLLELEQPVYRLYLAQRDTVSLEHRAESEIPWQIAFDRDFDAYLREHWRQAEVAEVEQLSQWQAARLDFEAERDQLSSIRAGLTPADSRPWTYVTSLFLHGGWDHLLGNMVFLFLFGLTLEVALGPLLYSALFILCGIAAGGLHVLLHSYSTVPLVGASGAISGLMGMYVSLYRLQNIRFFYTVFFYFGELKAPAILVLPLWLGKELYGYFFTDTNIAYMAHFGGLLAGAAVMMPLRPYLLNFQEQEQAASTDADVAEGLAKIQATLGALDLPRARALANQLCDRYPDNVEVWRKRFDLANLPSSPAGMLDETMAQAIRQFIAATGNFHRWREEFDVMLASYIATSPAAPAIDGEAFLALAKKFWQNGWREHAEKFLQFAITKRAAEDELHAFIQACSNEYRRLGNLDKARYIEAMAGTINSG